MNMKVDLHRFIEVLKQQNRLQPTMKSGYGSSVTLNAATFTYDLIHIIYINIHTVASADSHGHILLIL